MSGPRRPSLEFWHLRPVGSLAAVMKIRLPVGSHASAPAGKLTMPPHRMSRVEGLNAVRFMFGAALLVVVQETTFATYNRRCNSRHQGSATISARAYNSARLLGTQFYRARPNGR